MNTICNYCGERIVNGQSHSCEAGTIVRLDKCVRCNQTLGFNDGGSAGSSKKNHRIKIKRCYYCGEKPSYSLWEKLKNLFN